MYREAEYHQRSEGHMAQAQARGSHHDVFVSYSSRNKAIADAIVADFEAHGVRCWYAPRDILPGREWEAAIVEDGIGGASVLVLVYTPESNSSVQVAREVRLALDSGKSVVPLRLSDVELSSNLKYYLTGLHWLDAVSVDLASAIAQLRTSVVRLLGADTIADSESRLRGASRGAAGATARRAAAPAAAASAPIPKKRGGLGLLIALIAAVVVLGVGAFVLFGGAGSKSGGGSDDGTAAMEGSSDEQHDASTSETEQTPASLSDFVGTWQCDDFDYDGTAYTFQVSFDNSSICYIRQESGNQTYTYSASRSFTASNGEVVERSGFRFKLDDSHQNLILSVSDTNKEHQLKGEYVFRRTSDDTLCSQLLLDTYGQWLAQGDYANLYFASNGYVYKGSDTQPTFEWECRNNTIYLLQQTDGGTVEYQLSMSDDLSTLTSLGEDGYTWTYAENQ